MTNDEWGRDWKVVVAIWSGRRNDEWGKNLKIGKWGKRLEGRGSHLGLEGVTNG